jgi:hypothetical protein
VRDGLVGWVEGQSLDPPYKTGHDSTRERGKSSTHNAISAVWVDAPGRFVDLEDVKMTEEDVRIIAERFVGENSLDKCSIETVRQSRRSGDDEAIARDEWIVQFRFDCNDEEGVFANRAIVIVDDATGEPQFLENL